MNKFMTCVAALAALISAPAFAADMPVKAPPPAPAPVYSWTGWYVGLNAGGGWGHNTLDNSLTGSCVSGGGCISRPPNLLSALVSIIPGRFDTHPNGFIGGGQFGYNYQFAPRWVAGLEADFQGANIKGDASAPVNTVNCCTITPPTVVTIAGADSQKLDWFGTLRARFGWLPVDPLLVYATGGLAYGQVQTAVSFSGQASICCLAPTTVETWSGALSQSDTRAGWTVGGGLEWLFAPRWSLKAEYLYYDLGTVTLNTSLVFVVVQGSTQINANIQSTTHYAGNIARAGLNYHF